MKKVKKKVVAITIIGMGIIFIAIDWSHYVIKDFNQHISNQLRIAQIESNSNNNYMSFGPNLVVNYNGQVQDKAQIYNELIGSTKTLLAKKGIYLSNSIIKVDFNSIKIMSGIKYYPVEVYTMKDNANRDLKYSFYISLDSNIMPTESSQSTIGIDKLVNMVNSFGNNEEINTSYDLSVSGIYNYNKLKNFSNDGKKLYYKLCEMAELNIFGTTYVNGYNFVTSLSKPIVYNNTNYYEILMYDSKNRNSQDGGLIYKFYMTPSGNIVSFDDIKTVIPTQGTNGNNSNNNNSSNNNGNNSFTNTNTQSGNNSNINKSNNNSSINTNIISGKEQLGNNGIKIMSQKITQENYNNIYKLILEYENLVGTNNEKFDLKIISYDEIKGNYYYNVNIIQNNKIIDKFYISENGVIYRQNNN